MKFRVRDAEAYERLLAEKLRVSLGKAEREEDVFFTNEALGFPNEGKSLRIRRRGDYLAATFKGPRLDKTTKTREEIELPLGTSGASAQESRDAWIKFYERLGFKVYGEVVKTRRRGAATFQDREFELTLDRVEGIGDFAELELQAPREEFDAARSALLALATALDLTEPEPRTYLGMIFEKDPLVAENDAR